LLITMNHHVIYYIDEDEKAMLFTVL